MIEAMLLLLYLLILILGFMHGCMEYDKNRPITVLMILIPSYHIGIYSVRIINYDLTKILTYILGRNK